MAESKTAIRLLPNGTATAIPRIVSTAGEDFAATIDGREYSKRPEAVAAISEWVRSNTPEYGNYFRMKQEYGVVATLGGHDLEVRNAAGDSRLGSYQDLAITLKGVPAPPLVFSRTELLEGSIGVITRLENKVVGLPDYEAQLRQTINEKERFWLTLRARKESRSSTRTNSTRRERNASSGREIKSVHRAGKAGTTDISDSDKAVDQELVQKRRLHSADFPVGPGKRSPVQSRPAAHARSGTNVQIRDGGFER